MGKGGVFSWARFARVSTLSSFRPCGTCPPLLRKPSASLVRALALLQCLRCQSPVHLLDCCVLTSFHCKGAALLIQKMPGYPYTTEDQDSRMGPLVRDI